MFDQNLNSLVLRGSSVLCDGKSVGTRLGISYLAVRTPVTQVTPSRPSQPEPNTVSDAQVEDPPAYRAGRPVRLSGAMSSRVPPSVGRTGLKCWSWAREGSSRAAVMSRGQQARVMTIAGEIFLGRRPAFGTLGLALRHPWAKPAGRTPPASRGGQGS